MNKKYTESSKAYKQYFKRTKHGLISIIYDSQKSNSKRRGHIHPGYTKAELEEWAMTQPLFHTLFDNWVKSNHQHQLVPSVDRKEDNIGYILDNIQLMTWYENKIKSSKDIRSGKLTHGNNPQKPVIKLSTNNEFICEYQSINEAGRQTGTSPSNILYACKGERKTVCGYKWKYKKDIA